jgi:hypothetical protein
MVDPLPEEVGPLRVLAFSPLLAYEAAAVLKMTEKQVYELNQTPLLGSAQSRLFAKNAKKRGTHCVGNARRSKAWATRH